jgi:hypothetical protein
VKVGLYFLARNLVSAKVKGALLSFQGHTDMSQAQASTELPEVPAWQLEFARLIAFPAEPALSLKQSWWKELTTIQPDDYTLTQKKDRHEECGTFQDASLSLTIDQHRVEWLIEPLGKFDESAERLPTIGPFREKIPWFTSLMTPWLSKSSPPLLRLAFACKLLQPADTQDAAYRALARLLPGVKLTPRPNDFLYHVNRRRVSRTLQGLQINRMSTWSKLNILFFVPPGKPFSWPDKCYSAVQLDINTAPEKAQVLPAQLLPQLFEELVAFALEIAARGDVE